MSISYDIKLQRFRGNIVLVIYYLATCVSSNWISANGIIKQSPRVWKNWSKAELPIQGWTFCISHCPVFRRAFWETTLFYHEGACKYLTFDLTKTPWGPWMDILGHLALETREINWRGCTETSGHWEGYDQCQGTALHLLPFLPWCTLPTTCQLQTKVKWI